MVQKIRKTYIDRKASLKSLIKSEYYRRPIVDIIMPNYNKGVISEAVDSVVKQT